ncbi:MAG: hypothetical protein KGS61_02570 [Verrucomicrobia bacterium]|nr:hypothetical protein [Verrucomicrobiota bacterium]
MFVRSTKVGLVTLLCLLLGLHWGMLQLVAWTGMVIDYARTAPLEVALVKTFDGKHPCKLCCLIAKARNSENRHDRQVPVGRLDPFSAPPAVAFFPPTPEALTPCRAGRWAQRVEVPPTPPPILTFPA